MKPGELVVMGVFGLLVVGALVLAVRQGAKQREQVARYSASRGYRVVAGADSRLAELLEEASPEERWSAHSIMLVEQFPVHAYLFGYHASPRGRPSRSSNGTAFLAEHGGRGIEVPVVIFTRTPGLEALLGEVAHVGSQEFRRRFTVTCANGRIATEVVNDDIMRFLLEHLDGPGWYLSVTISGSAVLVATFWAESENDWDHLIGLGVRIREAVR
jgi:hypothetical protein